jgi:cephalosporin hydroxylase
MRRLWQRIRDKIQKKRHLRYRYQVEKHYSDPEVNAAILLEFRRLYYYTHETTWRNTFWLGHHVLKCPLDLWIYQEIMAEVRPDIIIETGTYLGGSALFFAHLCDLLGKGRVLTIDIKQKDALPRHPRIEYLLGSSTAPAIVGRVKSAIKPGDTIMAVLDSNHTRDHVLAELNLYSPLITPGSYIIVEDTVVREMNPYFGPGPREAVEEFLRVQPNFVADDKREKFLITFNAKGYLKRVV